ncbi:MAG: hypothetical protein R2774_08455 [Saprospiraceae bacterium]
MNKSLLLFGWITFFLHTLGVGQTLRGHVKGQNIEIIGAIVTITELDSVSILSYCISDESGYWEVYYENITDKLLKISYLGFKDTLIKISNLANITKPINISLSVDPNILEEVVVSDTRLGIVHQGDTLIYDVKAFKSETDTELKQVLNRMPGIEVDQKGNIYYNGKKVEKLLVEGKDILQDQHKLAGESLAPKDVNKIQIIEQYRSFRELFSKGYTEKVALNILLTEEAKAKVNGELNAQVGVKSKYFSKGSMYRASDPVSHALFLRSNNVGDPTFTGADYINMQQSLAKALENADGNINNILPSEFMKPLDAKSITEHFLAYSTEMNASRKTKINISSTGFLSQRQLFHSYDRIYLPSSQQMVGDNEGKSSIPFINLSSSIQYKMNPFVNLEIFIPFEYKKSNTKSNYEGNFNNMYFEGENASNNKKISTAPFFSMTGKIKSKWVFGLSTVYQYENTTNDMGISEPIPIFNSDYYRLLQSQTIIKSTTDVKSYIQFNTQSTKFGFSYNLDIINSKNNLLHEPEFNSFQSKMLHFQDINSVSEIFIQTEKNNFLFKSNYKINAFSRSKNIDTKQYFSLQTTSLLLKYSISQFHFLLLKAGIKDDAISFENCWENNLVLDSRTISTGYSNPFEKSKQISFSLSYLNFKPVQKRRLHLLLEFLSTTNPIVITSETNSTFVSYLPALGKITTKKRAASIYNHPISKFISLRLKLDIFYQYQVGITTYDIKFRSSDVLIGITSKDLKLLNFDLFYRKSHSKQIVNSFPFNGVHNEISININTKISKCTVELTNNLHFQNSNFASQKLSYFQIGFNLDCKLKSNLSFVVEGRDILNLVEKQIFRPVFRDNYYENQQFYRFQGNVTFGMRFII